MAADPLTKSVSERICGHMNKDHAKQVIDLVRYYSGLDEPKKASMLSINATTICFVVDDLQVEVPLPKPISNSEEAHQTLIRMLNEIPK